MLFIYTLNDKRISIDIADISLMQFPGSTSNVPFPMALMGNRSPLERTKCEEAFQKLEMKLHRSSIINIIAHHNAIHTPTKDASKILFACPIVEIFFLTFFFRHHMLKSISGHMRYPNIQYLYQIKFRLHTSLAWYD